MHDLDSSSVSDDSEESSMIKSRLRKPKIKETVIEQFSKKPRTRKKGIVTEDFLKNLPRGVKYSPQTNMGLEGNNSQNDNGNQNNVV